MVSSEVERTLVKSPPELWSELSNPDALARHLGEFGEIRITRIEPEQAVEWEAGNTAGTVRIKPSGWGTKVTLTATRALAAVAPQPEPQPAPAAVAANPEPELEPEPEPAPAVVAPQPEPEPAPPAFAPQPRRGFLSRLLGARRKPAPASDPQPASGPPDPFAAVREALAPDTVLAVDPFSTPLPDAPVAEEVAEEEMAAEEVAAAEVAAVLTSVLDRLGAAHHRPFSRA